MASKKKVKKRETYGIQFTRIELVHLRDLFSIMLPNQMVTTVSQHLAKIEQRPLTETKLWNKLVKKLKAAEVPTDDDAPDFTLGIASLPDIAVFPVADGDEEVRESYGSDEDDNEE